MVKQKTSKKIPYWQQTGLREECRYFPSTPSKVLACSSCHGGVSGESTRSSVLAGSSYYELPTTLVLSKKCWEKKERRQRERPWHVSLHVELEPLPLMREPPAMCGRWLEIRLVWIAVSCRCKYSLAFKDLVWKRRMQNLPLFILIT